MRINVNRYTGLILTFFLLINHSSSVTLPVSISFKEDFLENGAKTQRKISYNITHNLPIIIKRSYLSTNQSDVITLEKIKKDDIKEFRELTLNSREQIRLFMGYYKENKEWMYNRKNPSKGSVGIFFQASKDSNKTLIGEIKIFSIANYPKIKYLSYWKGDPKYLSIMISEYRNVYMSTPIRAYIDWYLYHKRTNNGAPIENIRFVITNSNKASVKIAKRLNLKEISADSDSSIREVMVDNEKERCYNISVCDWVKNFWLPEKINKNAESNNKAYLCSTIIKLAIGTLCFLPVLFMLILINDNELDSLEEEGIEEEEDFI